MSAVGKSIFRIIVGKICDSDFILDIGIVLRSIAFCGIVLLVQACCGIRCIRTACIMEGRLLSRNDRDIIPLADRDRFILFGKYREDHCAYQQKDGSSCDDSQESVIWSLLVTRPVRGRFPSGRVFPAGTGLTAGKAFVIRSVRVSDHAPLPCSVRITDHATLPAEQGGSQFADSLLPVFSINFQSLEDSRFLRSIELYPHLRGRKQSLFSCQSGKR